MAVTRKLMGGSSARGAPTAPVGSGRRMQPQDVHYLWALVLLEFGALWGLRSGFRRHHGG